MIEASSFGSIQVCGKTYTTDILVYPDGRIADNWWRQHGHRLSLADLESLLAAQPEVIVIGTGVYGRLVPEPGLASALNARGIDLIMDPTAAAAHRYNALQASHRTAAGFHLTC